MLYMEHLTGDEYSGRYLARLGYKKAPRGEVINRTPEEAQQAREFARAASAIGSGQREAWDLFRTKVGEKLSGLSPELIPFAPVSPTDATKILPSVDPVFSPANFKKYAQAFAKIAPGYDLDRHKLANLLSLPGFEGVRSMDQAKILARKQGLDSLVGELQDLHQRWGVDLLTAPENEAFLSKYLKNVAGEYGFEEPKVPLKIWQNLMQVWRQSALSFPVTLANNAGDIITRSIASGQGPGILDFGHNLKQGFLKSFLPKKASSAHGPQVMQRLERHGLNDLPQEVFERGFSGEAFNPEFLQDKSWLERTPLAGKYVEMMGNLFAAEEKAGRTAAYFNGLEKFNRQTKDAVVAGLGDTLQKLGADEHTATRILNLVGSDLEAHGALAPQAVLQAAQAQGLSTPEARTALLQFLQPFRQAGHEAGIANSHKIHFDYNKLTKADDALRNVMGFHFYATRSIPFYLELFAEHPGLFALNRQYHDLSEEIRKDRELSTQRRYEGTIPLPDVGLDELLFGKQGEIFINPTRLVSVLEPNPVPIAPWKGASPLAPILGVGNEVGLRLAPPLNIPLQVSGLLGNAPPTTMFRGTPFLNQAGEALTGHPVSVEGPIDWVQRQRPLNALGVKQPVPTSPDLFIKLRLLELAQEETGDAKNPEYLRAMWQGNSNPLWQRAARDLGTQGTKERLAALLGLPVHFDSETAHLLR